MYGKYVGLDIGKYSIKVTLIKRGLRDTALLDTWEVDLADGEQENAHGEVTEIFVANHLPKSDVAVGTPSTPLSIRVLKFPFQDPKKVDMVYQYELENVSTFDPEEKLHGYHLVRGHGEGSEAIVCMFDREGIGEALSIAERLGVDPKMVTFSPLAYGALSEYVGERGPSVLIDIGASVTSFALFGKTGLRRVRSSPMGGDDIAEEIARMLGVPLGQATSIMHTGFKGDYGDSLGAALEPLQREIRKTVRFFDLELGVGINEISITGGVSQMPGLRGYLAEALDMRVESLFVPELGQKTPLFSQSYALALYGSSSPREALNLRRGEYSFRKGEQEMLRPFATPSLLLVLIVILSFYSSCSDYFSLRGRVDRMKLEAADLVREMFPDVPVVVSPVDYLKGEVAKERNRLDLFEELRGGPTPIDMLKALSEALPGGIDLRVDEFLTLDDGKARVIGMTNRYEDVDQIQSALVESKRFKSVLRDVTERAKKNKIKFQFTLEFQ